MQKKTESDHNLPWWILSRLWKATLACLAVLSLWLCLHPWWLDGICRSISWLAEYRLWPWWYFGVLIAVMLLSLDWFRYYVALLQDKKPKPYSAILTGTLAAGLLLFTFCHRLSFFYS